MNGRSFASDKYRFGFNGKEEDNEMEGLDNSIDFGDRIYDPRLGKWFSCDRLFSKFPFESPYAYVSGNPIIYVDKDGKTKYLNIYLHDETTGKTTLIRIVISDELRSNRKDVNDSYFGIVDRRNTHYEYDWQDINVNIDAVVKNGKIVSVSDPYETLGDIRTTTDHDYPQWMAIAKVKTKDYFHDNFKATKEHKVGNGIEMTSQEGGKFDSKFNKTADHIDFSVNVDILLGTMKVSGGFSQIEGVSNLMSGLNLIAQSAKVGEGLGQVLSELASGHESIQCNICGTFFRDSSGTYVPADTTKYKPNKDKKITPDDHSH